MDDIYKRGWLEMTRETFGELFGFMKRMRQFKISTLHYSGYPVKTASAKENVLVRPDGQRIQICL